MDSIHLWSCSVAEQLRQAAGSTTRWLSAAESHRWACTARQSRRDQFLAGRWLARQALVAVYGGTYSDWILSANAGERPRILQGPTTSGISIGLSHSADAIVVALAREPVGVDVEQHGRRTFDVMGLANVVLAATEREALKRIAPRRQERHFLAMWALKEAWIKARGETLTLGVLQQLETTPAQHEANARVWQSEQLTLALTVAGEQRVIFHRDGALSGPGQAWRVLEIDASKEPSPAGHGLMRPVLMSA